MKKVNNMYIILITIPFTTLFIWIFATRWEYPNLFPDELSMRGINAVIHSGIGLVNIIFSSIIISLTVAIISVIISLMTSRAILDVSEKIENIIKFIMSIPLIVPIPVFVMGIHSFFLRYNLANNAIGVVIVHIIYSLPYTNFLIWNKYKTIGRHFEEQAIVLGADPLRAFFQVSLPLLQPVIFNSIAMSFIISFNQYFSTLLIGGGRVKTLMIVTFPYLENNDRSISSAYSLLFMIVSLVIFSLFNNNVQHSKVSKY